MRIHIKKIFMSVAPLLLFPALFIPYAWLNGAVIVDWLGCGCPKITASGEMMDDYFSANDFTRIFWLVVAVGVTAISSFQSRVIFAEKKWARICYTVAVFVVSFFIARKFSGYLLWS